MSTPVRDGKDLILITLIGMTVFIFSACSRASNWVIYNNTEFTAVIHFYPEENAAFTRKKEYYIYIESRKGIKILEPSAFAKIEIQLGNKLHSYENIYSQCSRDSYGSTSYFQLEEDGSIYKLDSTNLPDAEITEPKSF